MICPTPSKRSFRSAAEAKRFNRRTAAQTGRLWPYRCGDHYHLTTQNYDEQKRIRAKIRREMRAYGNDK